MKTKPVLYLIFAAGMLAACGRNASPNAALSQTPTPRPTESTLFQSKPEPTNTPLFQVSPGPTRVVLTETAVFPVPDQPVGVRPGSEPTPVATPDETAGRYRLKEWGEEDALALVQMLDDYAYKSDVHGPMASRWSTYILHPPIKISLQEALHRFPESTYTEALLWKLAVTNGILGNTESDEWVIATLEQGLNSGEYKPEELGRVLFENGFFLTTYEVQNLFGPEEDGLIYIISSQFSFRNDGLLAALREDDRGDYDLILIDSDWGFLHGGWWLRLDEVRDRTGNGVPEVPAINSGCQLLMLEWQGSRFVDLGWGKIYSGGREYCMFEFDLYPGSTIKTFLRGGSYKYYSWNGDHFELVYVHYLNFQDHLEILFQQREYSALITEIDRLLADGLPESLYYSDPGPAFPDVLRFYQGMAYIYLDQPAQARDVLEALAALPTDAAYPVVSQAAKSFLEEYEIEEDALRACGAAIETLEATLDPYRDESGHPPYEKYEEVWGFSYYPLGIREACNPEVLLSGLIGSIDPARNAALPRLLAGLGAEIHQQAALDVNGDGRQDWVLVIKSLPPNRKDTFVVVNYPDRLEGVSLRGYWSEKDRRDLAVDLVEFPGLAKPALSIFEDDNLSIYRFDESGDRVGLNELISIDSDTSYTIFDLETGSEYHLFDYWVGETDDGEIYVENFEWRVYRWNSVSLSFDEIDLIPEALFDEDDPQKTISLIQHTLEKFAEYKIEGQVATEKARLLYLLGLAYELNGQEALAVQNYWQVWRDFPGGPYALMGRAKLEPVGP